MDNHLFKQKPKRCDYCTATQKPGCFGILFYKYQTSFHRNLVVFLTEFNKKEEVYKLLFFVFYLKTFFSESTSSYNLKAGAFYVASNKSDRGPSCSFWVMHNNALFNELLLYWCFQTT